MPVGCAAQVAPPSVLCRMSAARADRPDVAGAGEGDVVQAAAAGCGICQNQPCVPSGTRAWAGRGTAAAMRPATSATQTDDPGAFHVRPPATMPETEMTTMPAPTAGAGASAHHQRVGGRRRSARLPAASVAATANR